MKANPQSRRLHSVCEHITFLTSVSTGRGLTSLQPDEWARTLLVTSLPYFFSCHSCVLWARQL